MKACFIVKFALSFLSFICAVTSFAIVNDGSSLLSPSLTTILPVITSLIIFIFHALNCYTLWISGNFLKELEAKTAVESTLSLGVFLEVMSKRSTIIESKDVNCHQSSIAEESKGEEETKKLSSISIDNLIASCSMESVGEGFSKSFLTSINYADENVEVLKSQKPD